MCIRHVIRRDSVYSNGSLHFSHFAMVFIASTDQVIHRSELYGGLFNQSHNLVTRFYGPEMRLFYIVRGTPAKMIIHSHIIIPYRTTTTTRRACFERASHVFVRHC